MKIKDIFVVSFCLAIAGCSTTNCDKELQAQVENAAREIGVRMDFPQ
jgi:hypothetical protein